MGSSFIKKHGVIANRLKTEVEVKYNGNAARIIALWDTGATNTCISDELVSKLSLKYTGEVEIHCPAGSSMQKTYLIDLILPNDVEVNKLMVIDSDIGKQDIDMLIGMDIICRGDFAVSNYDNKTAFTFRIPSEKKIDYVLETRISNLIGKTHGTGKRKKKK